MEIVSSGLQAIKWKILQKKDIVSVLLNLHHLTEITPVNGNYMGEIEMVCSE